MAGLFDYLPLEVLAEIISRLSPDSLYRIAACCRQFKQLALEDARWRDFHIDGSKLLRNFNDESLSFLIKRFPRIRTVYLSHCDLTNDGLMLLCSLKELLEVRVLEGCPHISQAGKLRLQEWMVSRSELLRLTGIMNHVASTRRMSHGSRSMNMDRIARSTCGKLWDLMWILRPPHSKQDVETIAFPESQIEQMKSEILDLMEKCKGYFVGPVYGYNHYHSDHPIHSSTFHKWKGREILVSGSEDGVIVWDFSNGSILHVLGERNMNVRDVYCCEDFIMGCTLEGEVLIWQLLCGDGDSFDTQLVINFTCRGGDFQKKKSPSTALSTASLFQMGDSVYVEALCDDAIFKLKVPTGVLVLKESFPANGCSKGSFSKNGKTLVLSCDDSYMRNYSLNQDLTLMDTKTESREIIESSPTGKTKRFSIGDFMWRLGSALLGPKLTEGYSIVKSNSKKNHNFANFLGSFKQPDGGLLVRSIRQQFSVSPNGELVALAMLDGTVIVWNVYQSEQVSIYKGDRPPAKMQFISHTQVAFQSDQWLVIFDCRDGKELGKAQLPSGKCSHWTFVEIGEICWSLVAGSPTDWSLFHLSNNTLTDIRGPLDTTLAPIVFMSKRNNMLFVSGGFSQVWNSSRSFGPHMTFKFSTLNYQFQKQWSVAALDVDLSGRYLVGITKDSTYEVIDMETDCTVYQRDFSPKGVKPLWCTYVAAAFVTQKKTLHVVLTDSQQGCIRVNVKTGEEIQTFGDHPLCSLTVDPSGKILLAGAVVDNEAKSVLYDLTHVIPQESVQSVHISEQTAVAFSPNSDFVALAQKGVGVFKLNGPELQRMMKLKRGIRPEVQEQHGSEGIHCMRFSPNGKLLAVLDQPCHPPWGLPARNTLIRLFEVDESNRWVLRECYDGGKLVTGMCWLDNENVLLGHADGLLFKQSVNPM